MSSLLSQRGTGKSGYGTILYFDKPGTRVQMKGKYFFNSMWTKYIHVSLWTWDFLTRLDCKNLNENIRGRIGNTNASIMTQSTMKKNQGN